MFQSQSKLNPVWQQKWHKSLSTTTNSSEAASRLWITQRAASWKACTLLTWATVAQRDWPALHLPAALSLGTRWMTYSLCVKVCEPVRGENRGNEKTTCVRDDKTRRVFFFSSFFQVVLSAAEATAAQTLKPKARIQNSNVHNRRHSQTILSPEVLCRLRCLLHEWMHTYTPQPVAAFIIII